MSYTQKDRTLALAGIFQAVKLVQQIARTGMVDQEVFQTCINSILKLDASSPEAVFGNTENLLDGYKELLSQLGVADERNQKLSRDMELTKYVVNVMLLERKLIKRPDLLEKVRTGVNKACNQAEHFSVTHENVIANLADLYSETVSTLKPRIMVSGEHHLLNNPDNANKIRALLLAAIRATVLWRQCGGNRWQMLFKREKIIKEAQAMVENSRRILH